MHAKARAVTPLKLAASPRLQVAGLSYLHQYLEYLSIALQTAQQLCSSTFVTRWRAALVRCKTVVELVATWRNHHVVIEGSCTAREQRWNGQITPPRLRHDHYDNPVSGRRRRRLSPC